MCLELECSALSFMEKGVVHSQQHCFLARLVNMRYLPNPIDILRHMSITIN